MPNFAKTRSCQDDPAPAQSEAISSNPLIEPSNGSHLEQLNVLDPSAPTEQNHSPPSFLSPQGATFGNSVRKTEDNHETVNATAYHFSQRPPRVFEAEAPQATPSSSSSPILSYRGSGIARETVRRLRSPALPPVALPAKRPQHPLPELHAPVVAARSDAFSSNNSGTDGPCWYPPSMNASPSDSHANGSALNAIPLSIPSSVFASHHAQEEEDRSIFVLFPPPLHLSPPVQNFNSRATTLVPERCGRPETQEVEEIRPTISSNPIAAPCGSSAHQRPDPPAVDCSSNDRPATLFVSTSASATAMTMATPPASPMALKKLSTPTLHLRQSNGTFPRSFSVSSPSSVSSMQHSAFGEESPLSLPPPVSQKTCAPHSPLCVTAHEGMQTLHNTEQFANPSLYGGFSSISTSHLVGGSPADVSEQIPPYLRQYVLDEPQAGATAALAKMDSKPGGGISVAAQCRPDPNALLSSPPCSPVVLLSPSPSVLPDSFGAAAVSSPQPPDDSAALRRYIANMEPPSGRRSLCSRMMLLSSAVCLVPLCGIVIIFCIHFGAVMLQQDKLRASSAQQYVGALRRPLFSLLVELGFSMIVVAIIDGLYIYWVIYRLVLLPQIASFNAIVSILTPPPGAPDVDLSAVKLSPVVCRWHLEVRDLWMALLYFASVRHDALCGTPLDETEWACPTPRLPATHVIASSITTESSGLLSDTMARSEVPLWSTVSFSRRPGHLATYSSETEVTLVSCTILLPPTLNTVEQPLQRERVQEVESISTEFHYRVRRAAKEMQCVISGCGLDYVVFAFNTAVPLHSLVAIREAVSLGRSIEATLSEWAPTSDGNPIQWGIAAHQFTAMLRPSLLPERRPVTNILSEEAGFTLKLAVLAAKCGYRTVCHCDFFAEAKQEVQGMPVDCVMDLNKSKVLLYKFECGTNEAERHGMMRAMTLLKEGNFSAVSSMVHEVYRERSSIQELPFSARHLLYLATFFRHLSELGHHSTAEADSVSVASSLQGQLNGYCRPAPVWEEEVGEEVVLPAFLEEARESVFLMSAATEMRVEPESGHAAPHGFRDATSPMTERPIASSSEDFSPQVSIVVRPPPMSETALCRSEARGVGRQIGSSPSLFALEPGIERVPQFSGVPLSLKNERESRVPGAPVHQTVRPAILTGPVSSPTFDLSLVGSMVDGWQPTTALMSGESTTNASSLTLPPTREDGYPPPTHTTLDFRDVTYARHRLRCSASRTPIDGGAGEQTVHLPRRDLGSPLLFSSASTSVVTGPRRRSVSSTKHLLFSPHRQHSLTKLEPSSDNDSAAGDITDSARLRSALSGSFTSRTERRRQKLLGKGKACILSRCISSSETRGTSVFQGYHPKGFLVAVKCVKKSCVRAMHLLRHEIHLLPQLNHRNIVRYIGTWEDEASLYLAMEYVGDNFVSLVRRFPELPVDAVRRYTRDLLLALRYLHETAGVVHRDVSLNNVVITNRSEAKLIDFGYAVVLNSNKEAAIQAPLQAPLFLDAEAVQQHSQPLLPQREDSIVLSSSTCSVGRPEAVGTVVFMSPQACAGVLHPSNDVWSLGILVYFFLTREWPYRSDDILFPSATIEAIASGRLRPKINRDALDPAAADFITCCLSVDMTERPSATTLLEHRFMTS